jgi:DNA-binding transcriptional regulator YdaS (Cro superfamily)
MKTAKVFKHTVNQTVRPLKKLAYEQVMAIVRKFKGKIERRQPRDQNRKWR